jgi:ribosome-binding protein aMBF1 (putative translation factor)
LDYSNSDYSIRAFTLQEWPMQKSTFTRDYGVFVETLKGFRRKAGLSQVKLAAELEQSQSFVSKCERGETRLDIVQLRAFCQCFGITLPVFVAAFEERLASKKK